MLHALHCWNSGALKACAERHDFLQRWQTNLPNDLCCVTFADSRQWPLPSRAGKGASIGIANHCSLFDTTWEAQVQSGHEIAFRRTGGTIEGGGDMAGREI
jgi:hypothetical protein